MEEVTVTRDDYDALPYPSHAYAFTHPDVMAVEAGLRGLAPAPVGQARVHHRAALVNPPPDRRHDALNYTHDVGIVLKTHVGAFEDTRPFHKNLARAVDRNFGHALVAQELFQRPQPQDVRHDLFVHLRPLAARQRQPGVD